MNTLLWQLSWHKSCKSICGDGKVPNQTLSIFPSAQEELDNQFFWHPLSSRDLLTYTFDLFVRQNMIVNKAKTANRYWRRYVIGMLLEITGNKNLVEMPNLYSWFFFRPMFIEIMYLHHSYSHVCMYVTFNEGPSCSVICTIHL